jgi:hypothetical protein
LPSPHSLFPPSLFQVVLDVLVSLGLLEELALWDCKALLVSGMGGAFVESLPDSLAILVLLFSRSRG